VVGGEGGGEGSGWRSGWRGEDYVEICQEAQSIIYTYRGSLQMIQTPSEIASKECCWPKLVVNCLAATDC